MDQTPGFQNYYIHYGKLYAAGPSNTGPCLCYLKYPFYTAGKTILSPGDIPALKADIIRKPADSAEKEGPRSYVLKDTDDRILIEGHPVGADGADPRPLSHAPRVDRVAFSMNGSPCLLRMLNSQNFTLTGEAGIKLMDIIHDGVNGGWNVTAAQSLDAVTVMGIYLFCRYLDKENEFVIV